MRCCIGLPRAPAPEGPLAPLAGRGRRGMRELGRGPSRTLGLPLRAVVLVVAHALPRRIVHLVVLHVHGGARVRPVVGGNGNGVPTV